MDFEDTWNCDFGASRPPIICFMSRYARETVNMHPIIWQVFANRTLVTPHRSVEDCAPTLPVPLGGGPTDTGCLCYCYRTSSRHSSASIPWRRRSFPRLIVADLQNQTLSEAYILYIYTTPVELQFGRIKTYFDFRCQCIADQRQSNLGQTNLLPSTKPRTDNVQTIYSSS